MTPAELAAEVEAAIAECRERVEGVGAQQYYVPGQPQRFEFMDLDGLFEYAEEEVRDGIVYLVMLRIRMRRLRQMVAATRLGDVVAIDRERVERLIAMVRAEFNPINDDTHRQAYRRAKEAIRDTDLDDLPDVS